MISQNIISVSSVVEKVGTAPTPKDFQSSAMTSSATSPLDPPLRFELRFQDYKSSVLTN